MTWTLNMSWCWPDVVKFQQHSIFLHHHFLRILLCSAYQMLTWRKKKSALFIFYCFFEFFGTRGVHHMKKWEKCLEVLFCPIVQHFWAFLTCLDMLRVVCQCCYSSRSLGFRLSSLNLQHCQRGQRINQCNNCMSGMEEMD